MQDKRILSIVLAIACAAVSILEHDALSSSYNFREAYKRLEIRENASHKHQSENNFRDELFHAAKSLKLLLTPVNASIANLISKRCIGSTLSKYPPKYYDRETQELRDLSLRYKCCSFQPTDCLKNVTSFLKNQNIDILHLFDFI